MNLFQEKIQEFVRSGSKCYDWKEYQNWNNRVYHFLCTVIDTKTAEIFNSLKQDSGSVTNAVSGQIGCLEGLVLKIEAKGLDAETSSKQQEVQFKQTKKVFIVHGHDNESKEITARFIEKLGLEPIILHEQPNSGRTIIEKFEVFSDVNFAVVLLTPDDIGGPSNTPNEQKSRARQNVILELGYFMGKLGRQRVCALYKSNVEIPSDFQGVLYIELDQPGAWRKKLAQEFVQVGFSIDLEGLLSS
ncbi:MAG: nucleotide-binding protein [Thermoguttaceae bacterium]|jgi:predicted nucleotide-binding protein